MIFCSHMLTLQQGCFFLWNDFVVEGSELENSGGQEGLNAYFHLNCLGSTVAVWMCPFLLFTSHSVFDISAAESIIVSWLCWFVGGHPHRLSCNCVADICRKMTICSNAGFGHWNLVHKQARGAVIDLLCTKTKSM